MRRKLLSKTQIVIAFICFVCPVGLIGGWSYYFHFFTWINPLGGNTLLSEWAIGINSSTIQNIVRFLDSHASPAILAHAVSATLLYFIFTYQTIFTEFTYGNRQVHKFLGKTSLFVLVPLFFIISLLTGTLLRSNFALSPKVLQAFVINTVFFTACTYIGYYYATKHQYKLHASFNLMAFIFLMTVPLSFTTIVLLAKIKLMSMPHQIYLTPHFIFSAQQAKASPAGVNLAELGRLIQFILTNLMLLVVLVTKKSRSLEYLVVILFILASIFDVHNLVQHIWDSRILT